LSCPNHKLRKKRCQRGAFGERDKARACFHGASSKKGRRHDGRSLRHWEKVPSLRTRLHTPPTQTTPRTPIGKGKKTKSYPPPHQKDKSRDESHVTRRIWLILARSTRQRGKGKGGARDRGLGDRGHVEVWSRRNRWLLFITSVRDAF